MSLAQTQELMATMKELMALLGNVEAKTEKIKENMPNTKEALATFRQVERIALRYLAIARRMGLPDDVQKQLQFLSSLVITIRMAQMSYNLLMLSTPVGWALGGAGLILTGLSIYDSVEGY